MAEKLSYNSPIFILESNQDPNSYDCPVGSILCIKNEKGIWGKVSENSAIYIPGIDGYSSMFYKESSNSTTPIFDNRKIRVSAEPIMDTLVNVYSDLFSRIEETSNLKTNSIGHNTIYGDSFSFQIGDDQVITIQASSYTATATNKLFLVSNNHPSEWK